MKKLTTEQTETLIAGGPGIVLQMKKLTSAETQTLNGGGWTLN